jgi:hypothetical protein
VLEDLSSCVWSPGLEQYCIAALNDAEIAVVSSAARALAHRGSPAARQAMLEALKKPWTPSKRIGDRDERSTVAGREQAIATALISAAAWRMSDADLWQMRGTLTTSDGRKVVDDAMHPPFDHESISLFAHEMNQVRGYIGHTSCPTFAHTLAKIAQYPSRTRFELHDEGDFDHALYDELRQTIRGLGMQVNDAKIEWGFP